MANLKAFVNSGFNNLLAMPDGTLHRQLARTAFEAKGDAFEPFVYGQKAWAYHVAQRFDVQLIMYGENGELEYGGSTNTAMSRARPRTNGHRRTSRERPSSSWLSMGYRADSPPRPRDVIRDAVVQATTARGHRGPQSGDALVLLLPEVDAPRELLLRRHPHGSRAQR